MMKTRSTSVRLLWRRGLILIAAASCLQAVAGTTRILKETGDVSWDRTTAVWYTSADSTTPVAYGYTENADTLISSSYFTGSTITISASMMAEEVVFDLSKDLLLTKASSGAAVGLTFGDMTAYKRGTGTLTIASNGGKISTGAQTGNCGIKKWVIEEGLVKADATGTGWGDYGSINVLGSAYDGFDVDVQSGGSLWLYGRQCTGFPTYSETVEKGEVGARITVHKGASFKTGDASSTYRQYAVRELTLAGGSVELGYGGDVGDGLYGSLKVIDKLAFTDEADAPYVWSPTKTYGNFLFAGSRLTEIQVDDITKDAEADVTFSQAIKDGTSAASRIGLVKSGAGTLVLNDTTSTFSGDVIISNGTLRLGTGSGAWAADSTYLGSRTVVRTVTVENGGTLELPNRYSFAGSIGGSYEVAKPSVSLRVNKGGRLYQSANDSNCDSFGDIWLDGGVLESRGYMSGQALHIVGTLKMTGDTPYVFDFSQPGRRAVMLNGSPKTVFDVGDITKDGAPDVTFVQSFVVPATCCNDSGKNTRFRYEPKDGQIFGFKKRGAGTMRLAYNDFGYGNNGYGYGYPTGNIDVEEGVLQIDNVELSVPECAMPVLVSAGAAVSGTGRVDRVTLAEGAGFAATAGQGSPLRVVKPLALPATGVVYLSNPTGLEGRQFKAQVVTSEGGVTGGENLKNWLVSLDGQPCPDIALRVKNDTVTAGYQIGMCLIVR